MLLRLLLLYLICVTIGESHKAKLTLRERGPGSLPTPVARQQTPTWAWITQRVDNFNPTDERTWQMRYLHNDEFFVDGGPMIIFLGGEWVIEETRLMVGQVYELAQENSGYMFYTEHRYYGESFPTEDLSTENLKYLSADQAMADVAYFIQQMKTEIEGLQNSKVLVIGGSYTGSLSTWMRLKYPHLVNVAWSSSGPLRSVADFYQYYEVLHTNIKLASESCAQIISDGITQLEGFLETEAGTVYATELFNACNPIRTDEPYRAYFFNAIAEVFAWIVQYAAPGQLTTECATLEGYPGSAMQKVAQYVKDYVENYPYMEGDCLGTYEDFLEFYSSTQLTDKIYRQWFYQCCTEYGYFQTTTSDEQPFGDNYPLDLFTQICRDLFGRDYDETMLDRVVQRTNEVYGSDEPEVTKLISVHGTVDPWHPLGLLVNKSETNLAVVVEGYAHCQDLQPTYDDDLAQMKEAKLLVHELVRTWLTED